MEIQKRTRTLAEETKKLSPFEKFEQISVLPGKSIVVSQALLHLHRERKENKFTIGLIPEVSARKNRLIKNMGERGFAEFTGEVETLNKWVKTKNRPELVMTVDEALAFICTGFEEHQLPKPVDFKAGKTAIK